MTIPALGAKAPADVMQAPRCIRLADVPPQPWRNGGGVTRELLVWPAADWQVRISVADIAQDGPFSAFPGVQRWFTVIEGAGVRLGIDDHVQRVLPGSEPLSFDGGAATDCQLIDGPTRDLNLMLRGATGGLSTVHDGQAWAPRHRATGLFCAVAGDCQHGAQRTQLAAGSLLWWDSAPASLSFTASAPGAALLGWWLAATPGAPHA